VPTRLGVGGPTWRVTIPPVVAKVVANEALRSQAQPIPSGPKEHVTALRRVLRSGFRQTTQSAGIMTVRSLSCAPHLHVTEHQGDRRSNEREGLALELGRDAELFGSHAAGEDKRAARQLGEVLENGAHAVGEVLLVGGGC